MLVRVTLGRDEYLGTPEEVVAFMAHAEGSPDPEPAAYMRLVAQRLAARMGLADVPTGDARAFLEALAARRVLTLAPVNEPSRERTDPRVALDQGPLVFGEGVEADDLPEA